MEVFGIHFHYKKNQISSITIRLSRKRSLIMLDINVCEKLLIQFSQYKPTDRKPTWMEICSFPQQRFEEICSRILKFFLKPDNPHGLKDLFIRSLEQCLSEKCMAGVVRGLEKSNQKEYVVTRGQNGIYRLFSLPEYENYIKEIESRSDKKQAFFLKRALDPYLINCFMNKDQQFLMQMSLFASNAK